jgi:hypothetical protein
MMMRDECSYEWESAENPKINAIQTKTGSQFKNARMKKFPSLGFKFQEVKPPGMYFIFIRMKLIDSLNVAEAFINSRPQDKAS